MHLWIAIDIDRQLGEQKAAVKAVEKEIGFSRSIAWIKMKENEELKHLHDRLCVIYERYGSMPQEFDSCFVYHSTLFLDEDLPRINAAFAKIKDMALPSSLLANRFLIGSSPDGRIGTYSVDEVIERPF